MTRKSDSMHLHLRRATSAMRTVTLLASASVVLALAVPAAAASAAAPPTTALSGLSLTDPYVLADVPTQTYYLYSVSTDAARPGVLVRTSTDLTSWSDLAVAYDVPTGAWNAAEAPSAPKVVERGGTYYLTVTLRNSAAIMEAGQTGSGWDASANRYLDTSPEATVIASAPSPAGPFVDVDATTPPTDLSLMTRDGTLYVDPDGTPFLVYAHDWIQKIDGTVEAVQLSDDLTTPVGDQFYLFKGSDAGFYQDRDFGITTGGFNSANSEQLSPFPVDQPQVVQTPDGSLAMLWTTKREGVAMQVEAISETGNIRGPWTQAQPLLPQGHSGASVFTTFGGDTMLLAVNGTTTNGDVTGAVELYDATVTDSGVHVDAHRGDLDGVAGAQLADLTAPDIYVPSTRVVEPSTTTPGATPVSFAAAARDANDGPVDVSYSIAPGATFPPGTTTVTVTAQDAAGNVATKSFDVVVQAAQPAVDPVPSADPTLAYPLTMPDMTLHDPFIMADPTNDTYYLYTANNAAMSGSSVRGVMAYRSKDLVHWATPEVVFTVTTGAGYWNANQAPWAPEVHLYHGKYYMTTTLHDSTNITEQSQSGPDSTRWVPTLRRATILAVSDTPDGPFVDLTPAAPVTPTIFQTLDGTLYVDPSGQPYLVYAHEWLQKLDGTMEAIPLTADLTAAAGDPILLWKSSDAPWYQDPLYGGRYTTVQDDKQLSAKQLSGDVTDGPELAVTPNGSLVSLWTTYRDDRYIETQAISRTGSIEGPWEQLPPLIFADKGHAMVFDAFDGTPLMVMHNHMSAGTVRGEIYQVELTDDGYQIVSHRQDLDGVAGVDLTDTLAPKIYVPATRVGSTTDGSPTAAVPFTALATDDKDGAVDVQYSTAPGSQFPIGRTNVVVTATDAAGNTSSATFAVSVVDKTALSTTVDRATALDPAASTADSWSVLAAALRAAQAVLADPNASQGAVDDARSTLAGAIDALVAVPAALDLTALQQLVGSVADTSGDGYTTASWDAFSAALARAQQVLADPSGLTQDQVDVVTATLQSAFDALADAGTPATGADGSGSGGAGAGGGGPLASTGFDAAILAAAGLALVVAGASARLLVRRRKGAGGTL